MIEAGRGFCFPAKALEMCFGGPRAKADHFKRDSAIETFLMGAINHALTAPANFLQQLVVAKVSEHFNRRCTMTPARQGPVIGRVLTVIAEQIKATL
jgi:hypothetical protein